MRQVYVRLSPDEVAALFALAEQERRHPAAQAGLLLVEALRQRGLLPEPQTGLPLVEAYRQRGWLPEPESQIAHTREEPQNHTIRDYEESGT